MAFPLIPVLLALGGGTAVYVLHKASRRTSLADSGETTQEVHDFISSLKLGRVPPMLSLMDSLRSKYGAQSYLAEALARATGAMRLGQKAPDIKGIASNPATEALRHGALGLFRLAYVQQVLPMSILQRYADFFRAEGLPSVATYLTTPP